MVYQAIMVYEELIKRLIIDYENLNGLRKKMRGRIDKVYCTPKCKNASQYEKRIINEQFY